MALPLQPYSIRVSDGADVIDIYTNYLGAHAEHTLTQIYNNIKTAKSLQGDYIMFAFPSYEYYKVVMFSITDNNNIYWDADNFNDKYQTTFTKTSILSNINYSDLPTYDYSGYSSSNANFYSRGTYDGIEYYYWNSYYGAQTRPQYLYCPSQTYSYKFNDEKVGQAKYQPVAYIIGANTHTNFSMINKDYANGGDPVVTDDATYFDRIIDSSDIRVITRNMVQGETRTIGWAGNNELKIYANEIGTSILKYDILYFIDGTEQVNLQHQLVMTASTGSTLYLSYLIDMDNFKARPSYITYADTGTYHYNNYEETTVISSANQSDFYIWLDSGRGLNTPDDPYYFGGDSDIGGGDGSFDGTSDSVDIPSLPILQTTDAGLITIYKPTLAQLRSLASYLWTTLDLSALKKMFTDPMQCIIGLSVLPVIVQASTSKNLFFGNIDTNVLMNVADSQFLTLDCGSITMNEYFGSYLDYTPYTKFQLYLPYISTVDINADDIQGKTINITYRIDILTGVCVAFIKCNNNVLYTFTGSCSNQIPVTSLSYDNTIRGIIGVVGSAAGLVSLATSGGMTAPLAVGAASQLASNAVNMKPNVSRSGSMGSNAGFLSIQKPYLIVTRPKQCKPRHQSLYQGYPTHIDYLLGNLSGYTIIENIHLSNIPATQEELDEIETLLKGGVLL